MSIIYAIIVMTINNHRNYPTIGEWPIHLGNLPPGYLRYWKRGTWSPYPSLESWQEAWDRTEREIRNTEWKRGIWS